MNQWKTSYLRVKSDFLFARPAAPPVVTATNRQKKGQDRGVDSSKVSEEWHLGLPKYFEVVCDAKMVCF